MLSLLGQMLLVVTLVLVSTYALVAFIGFGLHVKPLKDLGLVMLRPVAYVQWWLTFASFSVLVMLFLTQDYSVRYVALNSNSFLPWYYKISAVWGGHEGSLLLWALILSSWYALVARSNSELSPLFLGLVLAVLATVSAGFISFILFTSDPFTLLPLPHPVDGQDLNPLLQDFGLIVHPPLLYMGYVGLSVAFAFAIAGLIDGRIDQDWARLTRRWTLSAWSFLTLGIALGSWWAYYELGWGGWWFWDPVENASLMPWLAATGLIHSLAVTDKRGVLKAWTLFLAILAFSLSLLGTFLVRSGVLTSVHSFAADPSRGLFILGLLAVAIGGSLLLFGFRAHLVASEKPVKLISRESGLLVNNILLCTATFVILLGTLYPLIEELMGFTQSSVGAPYFNAMFVPLSLLVLFFLVIGPRAHWKKHDFNNLAKTVGPAFILGVVVSAVWFFIWPMALVLHVTVWLVVAVAMSVVTELRAQKGDGAWREGLRRIKPQYWGMHLAHVGLLVMVIGIAGVSYFSDENDVLMTIGKSYELGNMTVTLQDVRDIEGPNYHATQGILLIQETGVVLKPEKRFYRVRESVMTEAAIRSGFFEDIYVALGEARGERQWAVRVHYKPLVRWIWGGALLIALGGVWAALDRRYDKRKTKEIHA